MGTEKERSASREIRKSLLKSCEAMFGSAANKLAAMEEKWQRDRLVWISKRKIVELYQEPSDKMLHRTVLVRNTHSALTTWNGEEIERKGAFAFGDEIEPISGSNVEPISGSKKLTKDGRRGLDWAHQLVIHKIEEDLERNNGEALC